MLPFHTDCGRDRGSHCGRVQWIVQAAHAAPARVIEHVATLPVDEHIALTQAEHAAPARVIEHVAPVPVDGHIIPVQPHAIGAEFRNFIRSLPLETPTAPVPMDECSAPAPEVHSAPDPVVELEEVRYRIRLRREVQAALAERTDQELLTEEEAAPKPAAKNAKHKR